MTRSRGGGGGVEGTSKNTPQIPLRARQKGERERTEDRIAEDSSASLLESARKGENKEKGNLTTPLPLILSPLPLLSCDFLRAPTRASQHPDAIILCLYYYVNLDSILIIIACYVIKFYYWSGSSYKFY